MADKSSRRGARLANERRGGTSPSLSSQRGQSSKKRGGKHGKRQHDHHDDGTQMVELGRHGRHGSEGDSSTDSDGGAGDLDYQQLDRAWDEEDGIDSRRAHDHNVHTSSHHHQHRDNRYKPQQGLAYESYQHSTDHQQQSQLSHRMVHQEEQKPASIRRDYLSEAQGDERHHLLVQPSSPRRGKARSGDSNISTTSSTSLVPSSAASFSPFPTQSQVGSTTVSTFATFTTTSTSSPSGMTTTASFYSISTSTTPFYDSSSPSSSLASSCSSLSSSSSRFSPPPSPGKTERAKKRVTWVDELDGTQLEEVIEVERYLKQRGTIGWWIEVMLENKAYFLLLLGIGILFAICLTFILYKLAF